MCEELTPYEFLVSTLSIDTSECIDWPFPYQMDKQEYGLCCNQGAHRLACIEKHGPPPTPEHQACHRCGRKWCMNWNHIYWGTVQENAADRVRHAGERRKWPERFLPSENALLYRLEHPRPPAKLTNAQKIFVRADALRLENCRKRADAQLAGFLALEKDFGVPIRGILYKDMTVQEWDTVLKPWEVYDICADMGSMHHNTSRLFDLTSVAEHFDIPLMAVYRIFTGFTWKLVKKIYDDGGYVGTDDEDWYSNAINEQLERPMTSEDRALCTADALEWLRKAAFCITVEELKI